MNQPDAPAPSRIAAAQVLLDRGFGKAVSTVDVKGLENGLIINVLRMDTDELKTIEHKPNENNDLAQLEQLQAAPKEHATLADNHDNHSNEPDKPLNTLD